MMILMMRRSWMRRGRNPARDSHYYRKVIPRFEYTYSYLPYGNRTEGSSDLAHVINRFLEALAAQPFSEKMFRIVR